MANVVKLKRGSGSDPQASDLVVGELAIRTDTAKLFTKNDGGSVVEVSGGVEDNDITTSKIADDAVTYAKIQNVSATNRILGRDSSGAGVIEEITPANLRTMLNVADGATNVTNTNQLTNGAGFITATLTNEQVQDIVGGMLTGNTETGITVTYQDADGTIDFSVASQTDENFTTTLKNKLDGIAASATNVTNNNQLTNGAGYLTSVGTSNITNNAVTLDKIQDIDQNRIIGRVASGSGDLQILTAASVRTMINVEDGATADQSASEIVALIADQTIAPSTIDMEDDEKIKLGNSDDLEIFHDGDNSRIVDTGTGELRLDSNTLRIRNAAGTETSAVFVQDGACELRHNNNTKIQTSSSGVSITGAIVVSGTVDGRDVASDGSKLDGIESGATADQSASEILTLIKTVDGSGSGLDADTLDGVSSGSFVRSDADDTLNGQYTISDSADLKLTLAGSSNPFIQFQESTTEKANIRWNASGYLLLRNEEDGAQINLRDNFTFSPDSGSNNYKIWHENNDGSGSGLDSDTLDGQEGSYYRNAGNLNAGTIPDARFPSTLPAVDGSALTGISAGATGGGSDEIFYENGQTITTNYTITNGKNAMSAGPITINSGVTVTVGSGENWTVV